MKIMFKLSCIVYLYVYVILISSIDLITGEIIDYSQQSEDDIQVVEGKGGNYKFVEEDEVLILTRENFHYYILSRPIVLVEFYAPWCGHCKSLAPEYSKASLQLKKENNITLTKVDCTKEVELATEFMISGYPTIVLFRDGKKTEEYDGKFTSYGLIDYMREKLDPNWKPAAAPVLTLTSTNFSRVVGDSKLILVQFYAPWCKHCQQLEPEYEAAARTLQEYGIPLAKVDGPAEKALADAHQITGWPKLKIFRKGRVFEYKGPREHKGIVDYMKDQLKPPSRLVANLAEMKSGLDRFETTILGFFESKKTNLFKEYLAATQEFRGLFTCMHSFDADVAAHFNGTQNTILVYQPEIFHSEFEKPFQEYARVNGNADDIIKFVQFHSPPLVGHRTKRNEAFKYPTKPLVVVYYDVNFNHNYVRDTQIIRKKILAVAKIYKDTNIRFAVSNEEEYAEELKALGLHDANEDIKIGAYDRNLKFRMEPSDDLEVQELKDFIDGLISGKGKAHYRSQPVPKVQEGPVEVIVADNLVERVIRAKKDVLIEFYAPWCQHCKQLEPEYKKLAKKMKKENPNLLIAKMDATANDVHPLFGEIKGYPTIFFLPVGSKDEPLPYSGGELSYKALKAFVEEQASVFLTDEERMGLNAPTTTEESPAELNEKQPHTEL